MLGPEQSNRGHRRWLSVLLGMAVCSWFLFAFERHAPGLSSAALREIGASLVGLASRWGVFDSLLILWLCVAACLVGKQFLGVLKITPDAGIDDLSLSVVVGILLISWTVALLVPLRVFYSFVAYALLAAPLLVWHRDLREIGQQ